MLKVLRNQRLPDHLSIFSSFAVSPINFNRCECFLIFLVSAVDFFLQLSWRVSCSSTKKQEWGVVKVFTLACTFELLFTNSTYSFDFVPGNSTYHTPKAMKLTKKAAAFFNILTQKFFILLLFSYVSCNHGARAYKDGDIMLGGLFSIHIAGTNGHCGELYPVGLGHAEAMIFAIKSINKNPNLLPNVSLGYDIRDFCESTALAMQITYDFVRASDLVDIVDSNVNSSTIDNTTKVRSKPISALVGPATSSSAVLVGSLLQVSNIPAVSPSATSVELSSRLYKDFFRTVPPDNWQATVMADIIELFNWTYVAAVGLDDSYGRNGIWALEKESYDRKSFCVAFSEFVPRLGFQEKIKQTVDKIKLQSNIRVIIVWLDGAYGRAFFKKATDKNLHGITFILSDALTAEEAALLGPRFPILDGSLGIQPRDYPDPAFKEHLQRITPAEIVTRGAVWWNEFWSTQFNCSAKKLTDPGIAFCDTNSTSYNIVIRSPFNSFLIDAVYALAHALDDIYRCSAMYGVRATSRCPKTQPTVEGSYLQKYLRNVSFNGLTGKVQFDSSGDPFAASYDIVNFQRGSNTDKTYRKVVVGLWDKMTTPKLHLHASSLQWNTFPSAPKSFCASICLPGTMKVNTTPCCWNCIECPRGTVSTEIGSSSCKECEPETTPNEERNQCEKLPIINITFTTATGISISIVAFIGFVLTLLVCASYIKFYKTPIVKASSKEVSFLFLFGIATLFGLTVLELAEPSDLLCRAASVWRYSALNLCVTVMFLKIMRIAIVFQVDKVAQLFKQCFKTIKRQTVFISALNSTAISLIALWISIDPPGRQTIIRPGEYIFLVCRPFYTNTGFSLFIAVCTYTLTVALLCTYYAFKARGIPDNFNETKYIGFSMYILLLSSLAYYPVAFTFESWYVTLLSCSTTLVTSFGFLSCMFGPKVYVLFFRPQENSLEAARSQLSNYTFKNVPRARVCPASMNVATSNEAVMPSNPELKK